MDRIATYCFNNSKIASAASWKIVFLILIIFYVCGIILAKNRSENYLKIPHNLLIISKNNLVNSLLVWHQTLREYVNYSNIKTKKWIRKSKKKS